MRTGFAPESVPKAMWTPASWRAFTFRIPFASAARMRGRFGSAFTFSRYSAVRNRWITSGASATTSIGLMGSPGPRRMAPRDGRIEGAGQTGVGSGNFPGHRAERWYVGGVPAPGRIRAIDWLRGLAVVFMIQTHALGLLRPDLREGTAFAALQWVDGLVAPAFIFAAGFSMALTQVRAAGGPAAPEARRRRMRRTLRRLLEVLLVGILVNWMWFPIFREPRWIVRMDILPCIAFSLLIALPILFALAPRPAALRWCALLLAAFAFGVAPLAESLGPPWDRFLNQRADAVFPLLPWSGYVYLGAAVGSAAAEKGARGAALWLSGICAAGLAVWIATPWFAAAYPPHQFWVTNPANAARRWTQVCLLALFLLALEQRAFGAWRESLPVRFVEVFGTSSLAGYFFHQALLFYRVFGFSFESRWGKSCGWAQYAALVALLIGCTFVLTWLTDRIYQRADRRLSHAGPAGLAAAGGRG